MAPSASYDEIRAAHRSAVRRLHPDLVEPSERQRTQLQSVNDAWAVLGDENRRRAYDRRLATAGAAPGPVRQQRPSAPADDDILGFTKSRLLATIVRVLPVLLVLSVLTLIIVGTAYLGGPQTPAGDGESVAVDGDDVPTTGSPAVARIEQCVTEDAQGMVLLVSCSVPGAERVVAEVEPPDVCPAGSLPRRNRNLMSQMLCVEAP